jgi:ATPase subunit of ABC transporter with duplicated ATPase domains
VLNGIMLGLSPREARGAIDEVIEFAELEEFEDLKLKNYSSGMHVRLAFSVAIQVDADILLIDEVLAVGDAAFQQKCFDVFNRMRDEGKTIVFVTHDMGAQALLPSRDAARARRDGHIGDPRRSPTATWRSTSAATRARAPRVGRGARAGDGEARVIEVWVEDANGERQAACRRASGSRCACSCRSWSTSRIRQASVYVLNEEHKAVTRRHTAKSTSAAALRAGEEAVFSFSFDNVLAPGATARCSPRPPRPGST